MPFYEYECANCRYYAEIMQKISDAPLIKCPSCGKNTFKKLISAPVFRLKGSGWYETDFKSDQERKRNLHGAEAESAASEGAGAAKAEAGSDPKTAAPTETKPDAKTDAKADAKTDAKTDTKASGKSDTKSGGGAETGKPGSKGGVLTRAGKHGRALRSGGKAAKAASPKRPGGGRAKPGKARSGR
jgi:putative FmdB family regulatory protein